MKESRTTCILVISKTKPRHGHGYHINIEVDIAMARLRIGHVGLNEYLTRFNMANNQNCSHCNSPETVHHFLIECRKYQNIRGKLKNSLRSKGVRDFTVKSLLGGGNYKKDVQVVIQNEVSISKSKLSYEVQ